MRALLAFLILAAPAFPAAAASSFLCVLNRTSVPASFAVFQDGGSDMLISAPALGEACLRLTAPKNAYRLLMLGGPVRPCPVVIVKPNEWVVVGGEQNGGEASCIVENEKHHGKPFFGDRTPISLTFENRTAAPVSVRLRDAMCLQLNHSELTIPARGKVTETVNLGVGVGCSANTTLRVEAQRADGAAAASVLVAVRETDAGPFCLAKAGGKGLELNCRMRDRKNSQISILTK